MKTWEPDAMAWCHERDQSDTYFLPRMNVGVGLLKCCIYFRAEKVILKIKKFHFSSVLGGIVVSK